MKNRLTYGFMQPMRFIMILLVCYLSNATWAQVQSNVKGVVTDSAGEPLIGVSILIKGTTQGTITDLDGKFTLMAQNGDLISVSYIGYITQEIQIKDNKVFRIVLKEDTQNLDEVVVIGYGTQRKVDLTGSVSRVNLDAVRNAPNASLTSFLQGSTPGLNIGQVNTAGGAANIQIRGQSTINGNQDVLIYL